MPTPLVFDTADYQGNETLKGFDSTDALGKAYLDLHGKVSSGSMELLPEEIRKDSTIAAFKNVSDLAKGYVETKKMVGTIKKAPEKPEEYKFNPLANLHPNLKPEGIQSAFKGIFHKAGLHNEAADLVQQEVLSVLSNGMAQADAQRAELVKKNETALRNEWGADYEKKVDGIIHVLNRAGGINQTEMDAVAKSMKGSPTMLKALGKIVGLLSEDSIGSLGEPGEKPITDSKAANEAIQKLNAEIVRDGMKHPFYDNKHPDHDKVKKQMDDLFKIAYPS